MTLLARRRGVIAGGAWTPNNLGIADLMWFPTETIEDYAPMVHGDHIVVWPDAGLGGHDWDVPTGVSGGIRYETNQVNGRPAVRLDPATAQRYLRMPVAENAFSGWTTFEMFFVMKVPNDPAVSHASNVGAWRLQEQGSDQAAHVPYTDGNIYESAGTNSRKNAGNPAVSLATQFRLYNVMSKPSDYRVRIDGTQVYSTTSNTVSVPTTSEGVIGVSTSGSNSYYWHGWLAEIVLTPALTDAQRDELEAYFADRFALAIA